MLDCFCTSPKSVHCKIILLDEQELIHEIQDNSNGQGILDVVFRHLNLLETAYFGLRYLDPDGQTHWLDPEKKLNRQFKGADPYVLYFGVKFYAADPCKLLEEITRYQFFLQVKQDILQGRLPVTFELAAELGAYIVQSELGDFDSRRHSPGYVSEFRFISNQTLELETRIMELHKTLVGQLPSVAELNYLDKVKWLDMYGVDLHPVLVKSGEDNVEYFLGLTPSGIIVLRNKNTVGNYYWPRISKIYFKGRYFMLRVTDKNNDESTYGFETPSKVACKHLWKCCVEHHAFFRLVQVSPATPDIFSIGSRFRYSGRTEKQAVRDAQMRIRNPPPFSRTPSRRYQRRIVEGALETPKLEETLNAEHYQPQDNKHVSIPQPAQSFDSPYRATCNTPATGEARHHRADSPRSTRSAPWAQPHSRGLYNTIAPPSPRSVRSAGPRYRSSSIDSQSSNDSRSCKRRRHHRSRWTSDNESELSKCSNRSHRKHRRHRSRNKRDSGSEQDPHYHRHKSFNKHRHSESHYELVDSGSQWREIQKRQECNTSSIQQASVVTNRRASGYVNSGLETESETSYHYRNKHRKHRSRSKSPADKNWLPDELKKHLEFDLIDTAGMSESQLREIPYTVVQTNHAKQLKLKQHMGWGKSPPPPYSPQGNDVTRVRGMRLHNSVVKCESPIQNSHGDFIMNGKTTSSVASNSSTHSNVNVLPRMLDSMSLSENGYGGRLKSRMGNSALYCNPNTLLGGLTNGNGHHNEQSLEIGSRVNHEHTDSGLGAEQECTYDRSTENTKHGSTNKGMGGNEARGVPMSTPVSKSNSSELKILSTLDLFQSVSSQPTHSPSTKNLLSRHIIKNYNMHQSSISLPSTDTNINNVHKMMGTHNVCNVHYNNNYGAEESSRFRQVFRRSGPKTILSNSNNAFGTGDLAPKSRLTDNNTSLFHGSNLNFSRTGSGHSSIAGVTGAGVSFGAGAPHSSTSASAGAGEPDGPLRLQYRGQSVRSIRSTKSEGLRNRDNNNFIYFPQNKQNLNRGQSTRSNRPKASSQIESTPPHLPIAHQRSRSTSLEYILTPLIRSTYQH